MWTNVPEDWPFLSVFKARDLLKYLNVIYNSYWFCRPFTWHSSGIIRHNWAVIRCRCHEMHKTDWSVFRCPFLSCAEWLRPHSDLIGPQSHSCRLNMNYVLIGCDWPVTFLLWASCSTFREKDIVAHEFTTADQIHLLVSSPKIQSMSQRGRELS